MKANSMRRCPWGYLQKRGWIYDYTKKSVLKVLNTHIQTLFRDVEVMI